MLRVVVSGLLAAAMMVATAAPAAALPYDGTNPASSVCDNGTYPVYGLRSRAIYNDDGLRIGRVELRQSAYCATVWARVVNETAQTRSAREKIILYSDPNGSGGTTYTETDTLGPAGSSTDDGWSKQYRDRPSFAARGELQWGGVWYGTTTTREAAWTQASWHYPSTPYSCTNTSPNWCHRWPTTSSGGPITLSYAFQTNLGVSLASLPGDPESAIHYEMTEYEALSGGSPSSTFVSLDDPSVDVAFERYDDASSNDFALTYLQVYASSPRYIYYADVAINGSHPDLKTDSTSYRKLMCHEVGHVMGFGHAASRASCVGGTAYNSKPAIDDQAGLTTIYSTPLP